MNIFKLRKFDCHSLLACVAVTALLLCFLKHKFGDAFSATGMLGLGFAVQFFLSLLCCASYEWGKHDSRPRAPTVPEDDDFEDTEPAGTEHLSMYEDRGTIDPYARLTMHQLDGTRERTINLFKTAVKKERLRNSFTPPRPMPPAPAPPPDEPEATQALPAAAGPCLTGIWPNISDKEKAQWHEYFDKLPRVEK